MEIYRSEIESEIDQGRERQIHRCAINKCYYLFLDYIEWIILLKV